MKIKKSDVNILIMLFGILIAVAAYFFVFTSFQEKNDILVGENVALQKEVDGLQELVDNKQMYLDETDRMNAEIDEILGRFPSDVNMENILMYAINLENSNSIWINSIGTQEKQQVLVETAATQQPVTEEGSEETTTDDTVATPTAGLADSVQLYDTLTTMNLKTTYRSIKDIMSSIVVNDNRMNMQSVALNYDTETGCLAGTLTMNIYTMSGTNKPYDLIEVPGVKTGVTDIFQSGTVLSTRAAKVDLSEDSDSEDSDDADSDDKDSDDEDKKDSE